MSVLHSKSSHILEMPVKLVNASYEGNCLLFPEPIKFPEPINFPELSPLQGLFCTMSIKSPLSSFHSSHPGLEVTRIFIPSPFLQVALQIVTMQLIMLVLVQNFLS